MSILNVDKIQPIGGGSTITVDATDIQASSGTIRASTFSGDVSATGIGVTSLSVAGVTTFASNVFLGDDDRILFGDGGMSDAHVRYDGSHLQFGVASGQFRVSADIANFVNYAGTQTLATFNSTSVTIPTKLGINGAAPQTPLDVIANSSGYAINVRGRSSDNVGEIRFTSNNYGSLYGQIVTGPTYLNFNTGGVQRLQLDDSETTFNSTGADTDFRIRTPAQGHIFYVDAGNDQVCIKTSSAQSGAVLTVNGRTHINTQVTLGSNSTLDAGAEATIYKPATNTLAFATAGANERLRITSGGNIGIAGVTGTDFSLLDGMVINTGNGSAGLIINSSSSSHNAYLSFGYGSGSGTSHADQYSAYIGRVGDDTLIFGTNNNIRATIDSDGNFNLGLNSTPVSSSTEQGVYLAGANATQSVISSNVTPFVVNRVGTGGNDRNCIEFRNNGVLRGTIGAIGASNGIFFQSGTQEKMRITSDGDVNVLTGHLQAQDLKLGLLADRYPIIQRAVQSSGSQNLSITAGSGYTEHTGSDHSLVDARQGAMIQLGGGNPTSDTYGGYIKYFAHGHTSPNNPGSGNQHVFYTRSGVDTNTERLRITSDGCLIVGSHLPQNSGGPDNTSSGTAAEFVFGHVAVGVEIRSKNGASNQKYLGFKYGGGPTDNGGIRRDGTSNNVEFYNGSDRRIKTNIQDMDNTLSKICQMSLRKFDFKDGTGSGVGVIGQELINIFPEKVTKTDDGTGDTVPDGVEPWSVGNNYTYQILKAIQELKAENDSLKARIATLEGS